MNLVDFIHMPIPVSRYIDVCALLGAGTPAVSGNQPGDSVQETINRLWSPAVPTPEVDKTAADGTDGSGEIDAHGHHWSSDLHASTKGKTKEGLWRMKPGATRPDPLPGFPVDEAGSDTGTSSETLTTSVTSPTATEAEPVPSTTEEDDEFAAFREASAKSDAADAAAVAAVPARTFSDADLGALCNQAAVKLGDPVPVKELIAEFVPEGEIAHSRNVPGNKRADFVAAVEAKADIEFAG